MADKKKGSTKATKSLPKKLGADSAKNVKGGTMSTGTPKKFKY